MNGKKAETSSLITELHSILIHQ